MTPFTTVFDYNKLPDRKLSIKQVINIDQRSLSTDIHRIVKENMARQLAQKIMDSENFFTTIGDPNIPDYLIIRADCVVITEDELGALMHDQFKKGMEHATGFSLPFHFDE